MIQNSSLFQNVSLPAVVSSNNPVETKTRLAHDRIFRHLIDKGILHENGSLNLNFEHLATTTLKEAQLDRLYSILKNSFTIKSKNNHFEFTTSLEEIFQYLNIKKIEIVGGTVFYILGCEYMEELVRSLDIPPDYLPDDFYAEFEKPAADIDIRIPCTGDLANYKKKMCAFYETKVTAEKKKYIQEAGFTKLYIHPDYFPDKFSTISFGNRKDFSVDLIFIKNLNRKNLFKHDALQLPIFDLNQTAPSPLLSSNLHSILEPLILKLTKTLSAQNPQEIDQVGCAMLFSYLTKGWKCCSENLQQTLISKFLHFSKSHTVLPKVVSNHFPEDPHAASVLCFNACQALPETETYSVAKELICPSEKKEKANSAAKLLQNCLELLLDEKVSAQVFPLITACFHLFGAVLSFRNLENLTVKVRRVHIHDKPYLELKFPSSKPLHLLIPDDLNTSLQTLKNAIPLMSDQFKEQLFAIFHYLNNSLIVRSDLNSDKNPIQSENYVKVAFDLLEMEETSLKNLGFYLLCSIDKEENTQKHFPFALSHFLRLIQNEKSIAVRKNLLNLLAGYRISEIEGFDKTISQINIKPNDILKAFCLNFAKVDHPALTQTIMEIWDTRPELFNEQSNLTMAEKFATHNPRIALKITQKIKKAKPVVDTLLRFYLDSKNEICFFRDRGSLTDAVHQVFLQMAKYPTVPKQEEVQPYLQFILILLQSDFAKGMQLFEALKSKNAVAKGFAQIIGLTPPEKKREFLLKLNETSLIDFTKANSATLEERLESFFGCISDGDNSELLDEIIAFLKKILTIKNFSASNNLKNVLKPKLAWILTAVLNECHTPETLSFYFKMTDTFDPQIIVSKDLLHLLCKKLEALVKIENISFIKEALNKLSKNHKNITPEELGLYEQLAQMALCNKQPEIAEEFLKKIHSHSKAVNAKLFNDLLQVHIKNKNIPSAVNLISFFGESAQITDETFVWKSIVLNSPENKRQAILVAKSSLFLNDAEIVSEAQKIALSLLKTAKTAKGKAIEESFKSALDLIEAYQLANITEELAQTLLKLNHKALTKLAFSLMQKMNIPSHKLVSIFKILSTLTPEIYGDFFDKYEIFVKEFEGTPKEKCEFIGILSRGFENYLNNKSVDPLKVFAAFRSLENETYLIVNNSNVQLDFGIILLYKFKHFLQIPEINTAIWKKIDELLLLDDLDQREFQEIVVAFADALEFSKLTSKSTSNVDLYQEPISRKIHDKLTPSNILFVLEPLLTFNTCATLDLCGRIVAEKLETIPLEENELKVLLKEFLRKLVIQSIEKQVYTHLTKLIASDLFTDKEASLFDGMFTKIYFNDPNTIHSEEKLASAFAALNAQITHSPEEAIKFLKGYTPKVVEHLLASLSIHQNAIFFENIYLQMIQAILPYMKKNNSFVDYVQSIGGSNPDALECTSKEITVAMHQELVNLLIEFTTKFSTKIYKAEIDLTDNIQELAMQNLTHINILMRLAPLQKETILNSIMQYCYALTRLDAQYFHEAKTAINTFFHAKAANGFFNEFPNDNCFASSMQIMVFLKLGLDSRKTKGAKYKAAHIFDFLKNVLNMTNTSLTSFIVTYDYYKCYLETLEAGEPEKTKEFYATFLMQFKILFPEHAENPEKFLDEAVEIRNKTPALYSNQ